MKNNYKIFVVILVVHTNILAQLVTTPYKGTDTTKLNNWKVNKFDWINFPNNVFTCNKSVYGLSSAQNIFDIYRPLNSTGNPYTTQLFKIQNLDKVPDKFLEDGWELIKQDFGYGNNYNDGTHFLQRNAVGFQTPYLILYNKYKSVLRVIALNIATGNQNFIRVTLEFGKFTLDGKKITGSGLFRIYEQNYGGETALDKKSELSRVSNVAYAPLKASGDTYYADFTLAYDPCVCYFNSALNVKFEAVTQQDIKAWGVSMDIQKYRDDPKMLSSVLDDASGNISGGLTTFKTIDDLQNQLSAKGNQILATTEQKENVNGFNDGLRKIISIGKALNNIPKIDSAYVVNIDNKVFNKLASVILDKAPGLLKAIPVVGTVASFISMFLGEGEKPAAIPNPQLLAITGYSNTDFYRSSFFLATPNSISTKRTITSTSEYGKDNGEYDEPVYPMYNKPLGVFAMLKTPIINMQFAESKFPNSPFPTSSTYSATFHIDQERILYAFNKELDILSTDLRGYLEIDMTTDDESSITDKSYWIKVKTVNNTVTYQTPLLPLEELLKLRPSFYGNTNYGAFRVPRFPFVKSNIRLVISNLTVYKSLNKANNAHNMSFDFRTFKTQINVGYGQTIYPTIQNLRGYTCYYDFYNDITDFVNITNAEIIPLKPPLYQCQPPELDIYAWKKISIFAALNYPNKVRFHADSVVLENGAEISDEMVIDTQTPWGYLAPTKPIELDSNYLKSFCIADVSGGIDYSQGLRYDAYHSNKDFRVALDEEASIESPQPKVIRNSTHLTAIPNPATGSTTFHFNILDESTNVQLYVSDIMGKKVADVLLPQTRTQGTYQESFDISSLAKGIYLFTLQTSTSKETQRLVVE